MEEKIEAALYSVSCIREALATIVGEGSRPEEIRAAADFINEKVESARMNLYELLDEIRAARAKYAHAADAVEQLRHMLY